MADERLHPGALPPQTDQLRAGHYTDAYFNRSKELLDADPGRDPVVTMQVFQKHEAVLAGVEEAVGVLRECAGTPGADGEWIGGWSELEVSALAEGDRIEPWETVMLVRGQYARFAHLETVYLGILARGTLVATNVAEVVDAAAGKPVLFFPARHDRWCNQAADGWAAHVGGAFAVSTDAQGERFGEQGIGTVPHALIAAFGGDTVAAARAFADRYAAESNVTVLVDFDNDSVATSLAVAEELGEKLWGVRLDTAGNLVDKALEGEESIAGEDRTGVNAELARRVRSALDEAGHSRVKIVVSGGFDAEKVRDFERAGAPVDVYGVGSALLRGRNDFTADVVEVDGEPVAKVGRELRPNERLKQIE